MNASKPKPEQKRIRYKIPTYPKRYVVYEYDRSKFSKIYKKLQALAIKFDNPSIYYRVSPYDVFNLCYLRDKKGNLRRLKDQTHIFRYAALEGILERIAAVLIDKYEIIPPTNTYLYTRTGIQIYYDEQEKPQAEITKTHRLKIKERIKIHITLLKNLKTGIEIEKAVELTKAEHKDIIEKINDKNPIEELRKYYI